MQQDKPFMGTGWLALIILIAELLDGVIAKVFAQWLMRPRFYAVPELSLIVLIMIALYVPKERHIVIIAAIAGLIYDSFYTGMLGINALIWPLLIYCVEQMRPAVTHTPLMMGAVTVISLSIYDMADLLMNRFVGYGDVSMATLIAGHLGPSLLVNLVLLAIVYLPLSRLLLNLE